MDEAVVKVFDQNITQLNTLRHQDKLIRGADYDMATRKQLLDANRMQQNLIKYNLIQVFKAYGVEP